MAQAMWEVWSLHKAAYGLHRGNRNGNMIYRGVKNAYFQVGDSVFFHIPALKSDPSHELTHPFSGPFRIQKLFPNGARIVPIQSLRSAGLRVALNRLWWCPKEPFRSHDNFHGLQQEASKNDATMLDCQNTLPVSPHTELRISHKCCICWTVTMLETLLPSYRQMKCGRINFVNVSEVEHDHSWNQGRCNNWIFNKPIYIATWFLLL